MLNTSRDVVGSRIGIGGCNVKVKCASRGIVLEMRVHASHLTSIRTHPTCRLARLNVAPNHGSHITLVIHEPSIKVRIVVRVCRLDVGESSREWIFLCFTVNQENQSE